MQIFFFYESFNMSKQNIHYTSKLMEYQETWKSSYGIACIKCINLHE